MEFTSGQLFLFFLRGILVAAMPFAAFLILRKRQGVSVFPAVIGLITVMLILVPRAMMRQVFAGGAETLVEKAFTIWLIGAAFEELGRYAAMKTVLKNYDTLPNAICYGIGHAAAEVLMSAAAQFTLLSDAVGQNGTPEHLTALSEQGLLTAADVLFGNADNLVFHVAMSVIISQAAYFNERKKLIPLAIFLHVLANYTEFCFGTVAGIMLTTLIVLLAYKLCTDNA